MKSTLARLRDVIFKGKTRIPWAEQNVGEYFEVISQTYPELVPKLKRIPYANFMTTKDPWHASVALRRKEDFKGSGLSLHLYPDGKVVPSKAEYPTIQLRPATREEVGEENSKWLDPQYVAEWQASSQEAPTPSEGKGKGKGKAKPESSKHPAKSHKTKSSRDHGGSASSSRGRELAAGEYYRDEATGVYFRYTDNGVTVYWDPDNGSEYYYDEHGNPQWL
ncbi:hypothetical protein MAJ_08594, partial [Metarhizium majus ARSEF 297]